MSGGDLDTPRRVVAEVMESRLADGYVLLQPETGEYYGLDPLGSELWDAIKQKRTPAEFVAERYEGLAVSRERLARDITALVAELEQCRLIEAIAE